MSELTHSLYRPLNAPVLSFKTSEGERLFLLDTGCPISFAEELRELGPGQWLPDRPLPLKPPPFSLRPLRERLGLPIEGFLGLGALSAHGDAFFDFDAGRLHLGESARARARSLAESGAERVVTPLGRQRGAPISISARLDQQERQFYLDTGSRYIVVQPTPPLHRGAEDALYRLALVTPFGSLPVEVSAGHELQLEDQLSAPLCVATGAPAQLPNILGMEWLTGFNALLSFRDERALLFPRAAPALAWERSQAIQHSPPLELCFQELDYQRADRAFYVLPRLGQALPEGLMPLTPYRLKGQPLPAGLEGVNELISALTSDEPRSWTFVSEGLEHELQSAPLFQAP